MGIKVTNNATTTLASGIADSDVSLTVATGAGALFPVLGGGDYFFATLEDTAGTVEIIKVTARSSDTFTIVRAQEGTNASAFIAGSRVELRLTAQTIEDLVTAAVVDASIAVADVVGLQTALDAKVDDSAISAYGGTLVDDADAATARSTLGLGSMATQAASSVAITGGTATGLTNLVATGGSLTGITNITATGGQITGITDLAVADGGTGASDAATARTNLGLGTASSPQFSTIELGNTSDTTLSRSSAGVLAVEGVALAKSTDIVGQQSIWVPAAAMYTRTTNGAAPGSSETTTHKIMIKTMDFDTATQEFAQFAIQMPKSWDLGTLVCQFVWTHGSTTVNFGVTWGIEAVALANDDALDTAFGTAVTVADTGGTTNDVYISGETGAMTVGGTPAAEEYVIFQVKRVPADGSDNLAVDAQLLGVKIHYTTNAATDS